MSWILKLYPRDWRRRYGAEVAEVIASQPRSIQLTVDLLGGAIDAHMKPQLSARRLQDADADTEGEPVMISRLKCRNSLTGVSRRDALIAAGLTLGAALLMAGTLMLIENPVAETIVLVMSPAVWVVGTQWLYLRGHSMQARIGLVGGPFVILFLIGLATALLQQRIG